MINYWKAEIKPFIKRLRFITECDCSKEVMNMGINNYELNIDDLMKYVLSNHEINFVIDFTAFLRGKSQNTLYALSKIPTSKCCWYTISKFREQINILTQENNPFGTDYMLSNLADSWDVYSSFLQVHLQENFDTAYDFFQSLPILNRVNCFITGNETEAWRHILSKQKGNIILITDKASFYFAESCYNIIETQMGNISSYSTLEISNDIVHTCRTSAGRTIRFDDILCDSSAEGVLYRYNKGKNVAKIFSKSIASTKISKINYLIEFEDKQDNFAWPLELLYLDSSTSNDGNKPIGLSMPFIAHRQLEELFYCELSEHQRWNVAVNFLSQALFLYLHDIQITDFNFNNFGVTDNCEVVMMDMDSYTVGKYGSQVRCRQVIPMKIDYKKKSDVIKSDYLYLVSCVFRILMDGSWPYYYNEDNSRVEYYFQGWHSNDEEQQKYLDCICDEVKIYYEKVFEKKEIRDPFELYFYLMKSEPKEVLSLVSLDSNEESTAENLSFFKKIGLKIKELFSR